ncbi:reductive dehalogenase [Dehalogenimonas etheniformans]|uniref:Reductive dehalogenase n=1 Tax=Dehalogenimonas etheniformans TaxID=1536648 RepID=A0A2P5PA38_9CHLR|nr:reductive dehalogenase [Dehalogenimonas etheniformans]PPD59176.1 reductive dehalogenase [Dehalogenimonas etheniformans]QNT75782.1 reductive dehalogenase [Dehalogenimonas etheniformans]
MSKFHHTVSRREFMKIIGLAGAGVGGAALVAPTFHDLDEVIASESGGWKRPWWIKSVDEPTVEVDWSHIKRYDHRIMAHSSYPNAQHWGADKWRANREESSKASAARVGTKGNTLRDTALGTAGGYFQSYRPLIPYLTKKPIEGWMGVTPTNPEKLGMAKWQGTPEENTRMVRAAAICFGAGNIGTAELAGHERNLVYTHTRIGPKGNSTGTQWIDNWPPPAGYWRKIDFENVDVGYNAQIDGVDDCRLVLPDRPLWDISVMIPMARASWSTTGTGNDSTKLSSESNTGRYRMFHQSVYPCLQMFINILGWHSYGYGAGDGPGGMMPSEASAVVGGVSEMGRSSEICINPEHGPVTGYYSVITDLPLQPAKPIDAGIFRFCHTCRRCAEFCPSQAISHEAEPSWDIPKFDYLVPNMINAPGKRLFWTNTTQCQGFSGINGCSQVCRGICTMNTETGAMVHGLIKQTVSTTSLFNGFFWEMGKTFGYELMDADTWWEIAPGLPTWGTGITDWSSSLR